MKRAICFAAFVFLALLSVQSSASAAPTCESLLSLTLPDATMTFAKVVPAGMYTPNRGFGAATGKTPTFMMPAYCSVHLVVKPAVNIEVWLPIEGWNGKIATVGDQGTAGYINYIDMITPLKLGYATASTDSGHLVVAGQPGFQFAAGHPELVVDYGYRGVHEMTLKTKQIVESFYGTPGKASYFIGCSNAGREALMEVKRYPNDYDGVLAGAPLVSWTRWVSENALWDGMALLRDPESSVPSSKLPAIADAAMAACDAKDGIKDGIINDPSRCHFDPSALLCKGEDSPSCLTSKQVEAVKKIYTGPILNGKAVFQGYMPGSERSWSFVSLGTEPNYAGLFGLAEGFFKNVMYNDPNWDFHTWSYEKNLPETRKKLSDILDADSTDLKPFQAHEGKLIIYHGWSDPTLAPVNTIKYYEGVEATIKNPTDTVRLFMVPGMYHCGGGPGPHTFDAFGALVNWVEHKQAPEKIIASNGADNPGIGAVNQILETPDPNQVKRTRPLCPYPQTAQYTGQGSTDDASHFVCALPEAN